MVLFFYLWCTKIKYMTELKSELKEDFLKLEKEFNDAFDEFKKPFLAKMRTIAFKYNKEKGEELIILKEPELDAPDILRSMRFRMKLDDKKEGFYTQSIMEIIV